MITSRTKKQLMAFVLITLIGVSYVGARYAKLGQLFYDSSYQVTAHYLDSGGIFTGAEVTYRGVTVGRVTGMELSNKGVDVQLSIDKNTPPIPSDTIAQVANKSAVGEQFVDLQPQKDSGPYLREGSQIESQDTRIPVSTREILTNMDNLLESIPQADLRTVVSESGAAFKDAGPSIGQIIDTSNSFIDTAQANFQTTTALIRDSRVVLQTQADKGSAIRSFTTDLAAFSGTVAANDKYLRSLIDNGSATANELRTFLQQNKVDLGDLINNLVTTNEVAVKYLPGARHILIIYPYIVAGGYTVAAKNRSGHYDARFGLILTGQPANCEHGYESTDRRSPQNRGDRPMNMKAGCTDPSLNQRGAEKSPGPSGSAGRAPVATYDQKTGKLTWADQSPEPTGPTVTYDGGAARLFGADSWKWLVLQPSLANQE